MRSRSRSVVVTVLACFFLLQPLLAQYKRALPGYQFEFPRDYFSHPDYQTEWWYYTGNLQSADGRKFGFELTFFRSAVTRDASETFTWDIRDLYFAHFAVSDLDGGKFLHTERTNRSGPGIAGADSAQQRVWNGNWSVVWKGNSENLTALAGRFAIHLTLKPQKPPVIHGENGASQKSDGAGRASHYFSETRLQASGYIEIESTKYEVTGLAWMDHEFFTEQLAPDQVGWDWLSLQLSDDTELMLFHIRRKDGAIDPHSAGTFIDTKGRSRHLKSTDFELEPDGQIWTSPANQAKYPVGWKIRVPALGIEVKASTPLRNQEFAPSGAANAKLPSYWEGAIFLKGMKAAEELRGSGYLEMTGYDRPVLLP